ncbi:MAG: hypothetical protein AABW82_03155 [Nanoarchaeota archaeon]
MLTELESEVVASCKDHGFAAYLQCAWFEYPRMKGKIARPEFPKKPELTKWTRDMGMHKTLFDIYYLHKLKTGLNPLKVEQQCWELLSPRVENHLTVFNGYLDSYNAKNAKADELLPHLDLSWDLLQKWNVISNSYKAKYCMVWSGVKKEEKKVRSLIAVLSSS